MNEEVFGQNFHLMILRPSLAAKLNFYTVERANNFIYLYFQIHFPIDSLSIFFLSHLILTFSLFIHLFYSLFLICTNKGKIKGESG